MFRIDPRDLEELRPLIAEIVRATLMEMQGSSATAGPDLSSLTEAAAAELLGLRPWQLRDLRRKGKVAAFVVGRNSPRYTRQALIDYQKEFRDGIRNHKSKEAHHDRNGKPAT